MSIEIRGNKYRARVTRDGQKYAGLFNSRPEAEAWIAELKYKLHMGLDATAYPKSTKDITLKELFIECFNNVWAGQKDEDNALYLTNKIANYIGNEKPIRLINLNDIESYIQYMKKDGKQPSTINRHLAKLRRALRYAHDKEYITGIPKIPVQREEESHVVFWSREEEQQILKALDVLAYTWFIEFFKWQIDTGMRPNESRQINRKHIRYDNLMKCHVVDIPNNVAKWGGGRTIPLTPRAYEAFVKSMLNAEKRGWHYAFGIFTNGFNRDVWNALRKEMGNDDPTFMFYSTRHTCATRLLQGGMDIKRVKDWLGHKNISTTERYARLVPANLVSGLDILAG